MNSYVVEARSAKSKLDQVLTQCGIEDGLKVSSSVIKPGATTTANEDESMKLQAFLSEMETTSTDITGGDDTLGNKTEPHPSSVELPR